ncbi:MAG: LamG domain-containing protein [bacterium]|nr:LamG domain-containing protein [bacterium]
MKKIKQIYLIIIAVFFIATGCSDMGSWDRIEQQKSWSDEVKQMDGPHITSAEYYDTNSNGYIDHLKLTFDKKVDDSTFDGYSGSNNQGTASANWNIAGYGTVRIDTSDAIDGSGGENDTVLWLAFDESGSYDTGATPDLTVSNSSLTDDEIRKCYLNTSSSTCFDRSAAALSSADVTETDKAAPILVDAVGEIAFSTITISFSEAVDTNGGTLDTPLAASDFTYIDGNAGDAFTTRSMGTDSTGYDNNQVTIVLSGSLTCDDNTDSIAPAAGEIFDAAGNSALTTPVTIDSSTIDPSLVAFYPFSWNATDKSGNGNHLIIEGGVSSGTDRGGAYGYAYNFDGINSRLYRTDTPGVFDIGTDLTISAWVNIPNTSGSHGIAGKGAGWYGYVMTVNNGGNRSRIWDSTTAGYETNDGTVPAGTWTHIALTWNTNGKMRAYINGAIVREINAGANPIGTSTVNEFVVGSVPWTPSEFFTGTMDDLRVYNRELSTAEIVDLVNLPAD